MEKIKAIADPFLKSLENANTLDRKTIIKSMLSKIFLTKDNWFNKDYFEDDINKHGFGVWRVNLNKDNTHCLAFQGWKPGYKTTPHTHDTYSSSIINIW